MKLTRKIHSKQLRDVELSGSHFLCLFQPRRNAILDEKKKWKFPIPYILTDSLGVYDCFLLKSLSFIYTSTDYDVYKTFDV